MLRTTAQPSLHFVGDSVQIACAGQTETAHWAVLPTPYGNRLVLRYPSGTERAFGVQLVDKHTLWVFVVLPQLTTCCQGVLRMVFRKV